MPSSISICCACVPLSSQDTQKRTKIEKSHQITTTHIHNTRTLAHTHTASSHTTNNTHTRMPAWTSWLYIYPHIYFLRIPHTLTHYYCAHPPSTHTQQSKNMAASKITSVMACVAMLASPAAGFVGFPVASKR
jgi:hypothetical protein